MIIYVIKNKLDGKMYIGQTTKTAEERFRLHCNAATNCRYLKAAIKAHGKENFEVKVLARCESVDEMNHREAYYIKLFNSLAPSGYNLMTGGHHKNSRLSKVSRKKLSESHKRLSAAGNNGGNWKKGHQSDTQWKPGFCPKSPLNVKGHGQTNSGSFKSGQSASPSTQFKQGFIPSNKGKKKYINPVTGKVSYK
jgi:group I intron endonuclease